MSVKAIGWAWEQALPQPEKLMLLALADHANDEDGVCWPSYEHLARKCGCSRRSAITHVKRLAERGLLTVYARSRQSNRYRLSMPGLAEATAFDGADISPRGETSAPRGENRRTGGGETSAPRGENRRTPVVNDFHPEPTTEPSQDRHTEPSQEQGAPDGAGDAGASPCAGQPRRKFEWYQQTWNDRATLLGLPRVQALSGQRRRHLRARAREPAFKWSAILDKVEALVQAARQGQQVFIVERGVLDFDFITKNARGYLRLLEGAYDPRPGSGARDSPRVTDPGTEAEGIELRD